MTADNGPRGTVGPVRGNVELVRLLSESLFGRGLTFGSAFSFAATAYPFLFVPSSPPIFPPAALPCPSDSLMAPRSPWRRAWGRRGFRLRLGLVLTLLLALLPVLPGFYHWVQTRPGYPLADPLLDLLPVHDNSVLTFSLIYGAIVGSLAAAFRRPPLLARMLWCYYLLQLLRMATLTLLPLEPPTALLPLHDPVVDHLFQVQEPIVRDLFFSGHTATMMLLALASRGRWRWVLGGLTVAVGLLVLVQRVHYSYDVLAAPFFAWAAWWLAGRICRE